MGAECAGAARGARANDARGGRADHALHGVDDGVRAASNRDWRVGVGASRGVAAAYFVHHTARRARAADVPEPYLHVYCAVIGVEPSDGKLVTPNQAAWVRSGHEGGACFRAELAKSRIELGT